MKLQKEIGEKMKAARLEKKVSQQALSRQTGITQKRISSLENGNQNATISTLGRIADALDKKLLIDLESK